MSLTVRGLLNGEIEEKYNDRIFWYASEVKIEDNVINLFVDNTNVVTFDDINLDCLKISELRNIKHSSDTSMKNILISSGSFLFINNKLVVTQRELTTQYDPGFWTTPAGRCDRTILETGIKETIEEIEIKRNNKIILPDISKEFVSDAKNIDFYHTSFVNENFSLTTYDVNLYLDNILIEECKSWVYISKEVNTIEFRIPIFAKLDENELTFTNPEFGTDTGLKSIEELQKLQVVPALKQLIREIENDTER